MLSSAVRRKDLIPVRTSVQQMRRFLVDKEGARGEFAFVWQEEEGVSFDDPFAPSIAVWLFRLAEPAFWNTIIILKQTLFSIYHMNENALEHMAKR